MAKSRIAPEALIRNQELLNHFSAAVKTASTATEPHLRGVEEEESALLFQSAKADFVVVAAVSTAGS